MRKAHKFRAKPTTVDGIRFPSKREAERYGQLKLLEKAGKIKGLRRQVAYELVLRVKYLADFVYEEQGETIVEDAKGCRTREYVQKRKAMREQHGIVIRET